MKREETPEEMTETFVDRDDFLYYHHVTFGKRVKKFGPQDSNSRPILVSLENNKRPKIIFVRKLNSHSFESIH